LSRGLRIAAIAAASLLGVVVLVFALAWALMPRDWIERQALRQASQMKGAAVQWKRMTPAFDGLAIGIKLEGLSVRIPATGDAKTDARTNAVFVRMKLLPLLFRRVEVSSAKVEGAWIALYDRGPEPAPAPGSAPAPGFAVLVPRLEFHDVNVRTRDALGSGMELKGLDGHVELAGSLDAPAAIRVSAKAESLYWKPSLQASNVPFPSPLDLNASLEPKGNAEVLEITKGSVELGALASELKGSVRFPKKDKGDGRPELDLRIAGEPQKVDSGERAWKALASNLPAKWNGTVAWNIRVKGSAPEVVTEGTLTVSRLSVSAKDNSFLVDQVRADWSSRADRTFVANAAGGGSGVTLSFHAGGSLAPGGATNGVLVVRAPASRLNGLLPNTPTWRTGNLECRASFELRPPAKPAVRWTVRGWGIDGTMQGLAHPVRGLDFDVEGSEAEATVRSLKAGIGSTTVQVTGTLVRGKPLNTGTFRIALDRLIAEEWAPPAGSKAPGKVAAPPPAALPIPLGAFTGAVEVGEARSGGMRVTNISAPVRFDGADLVASPIKGTIGSGGVEGSLTIKSLFGKPSYVLHLDVKRAPVEQVAAGTIPFSSAVTGFLTGVVDLSGQGLPSALPNETLRGLLKGTLEDGKLKLSPTVIAVARSLGLPERTEMPVTEETHTVRIIGSKMVIDQARGDLGGDKAEMNGSVGLDHMLDLNLLLRLAPSRIKGSTVLSQLAQYARDAEGRLPVMVKITGLDRAPRISFNVDKTLQVATKQLGRQVVTELVKNLARRPDSLRKVDSTLAADSARNQQLSPKSPADSTAKDPLKKATDALKQIFRK
jgi:hypothetical protein